MKKNINEIIYAENLTLNEWLELMTSERSELLYPNNCFPSENLLNEYITCINSKDDREIKGLLRKLLVQSGCYGTDNERMKIYRTIEHSEKQELIDTLIGIKETEYYHRLKSGAPWEGITWILDLLPDSPKKALDALDAFHKASCAFLPDNALVGIAEAEIIIRAKYINYIHPKEILLSLTPEEFEQIVGILYSNMGYHSVLTKSSYDGGIDIIADRAGASLKERLLIQCKRYSNNIGIKHIRELLGVVSDKKATKGVLVCCAYFTREAIKLSKSNSRIELINHLDLIQLLNENLGTYWPFKISNYLKYQNIMKE